MTDKLRVLVVDDQPAVVTALAVLFDLHNLPNCGAASPAEACRIAARETLGAVVMDMNFAPHVTSGEEGVELFNSLREIDPDLPIVVITAWASLEAAVDLVKAGAADYLEKPWQDDRLVSAVRNLVELRSVRQENRRLRAEFRQTRTELAEEHELNGIVYRSPAMHGVVSLAISVADSSAPVLITGPSGSGKEMLAEIVQANSARRNDPFVRVNVGAIPEELMESELFGAEAGAYTGITGRRIGHFETADRGTIFLDEIDGLSLAGQVKLLRVLQSGEFRRLGSSSALRADVRVISATNADLVTAVGEGLFREDLYYRLNVVELRVPSLADRADDVLPLARHFLERHAPDASLELADETVNALLDHEWPGNVRELENRIQRATVVATGQTIQAADLGIGGAGQNPLGPLDDDGIAERDRLLEVLDDHRGVVAHAADELGISRQALYRKMERL
ncbi:MAG: sigma-54 dependent transcriptional regulator, partial [Acidobacteriota bacterium]|nr:sigma-54 dependent transcriptional regulator [Acidobacteriota bacterium]